MRTRIVSLLALVLLSQFAASSWAGNLTPIDHAPNNAVTFAYEPSTGNLSYDDGGYGGITTMEIKSAASLFTPENVHPDIIVGPFDVFTPAKFFTLTTSPNQHGSRDIGPVLPKDMTYSTVIADLSVNGSVILGGFNSMPGGGPYLRVPEPGGVLTFACGLLGLASVRRRVPCLKILRAAA